MGLLVSGKNPASLKTAERIYFTATAGQTTFTVPNGYVIGDLDVFLNGLRLSDGEDYTAVDGTNIILTSAASVGDSIFAIYYNVFLSSSSYTKAEADARYLTASATTPLTGFLRTPNYGVSSTSDSLSTELTATTPGQVGTGVKAYGRSMATYGGDLHHIADTRGAGGSQRFYGWNGTSLTTMMNIDSSGRVTKPLQPGFEARVSGLSNVSLSGGAEHLITFNTTSTNRGGNYNTSNYRFTAPVAGFYSFTVCAQINGINNTSWAYNLQLRRNGSHVAGPYLGSANLGYDGGTTAAIIYLNANEYVEAWMRANTSCTMEYGASDGRWLFTGSLIG